MTTRVPTAAASSGDEAALAHFEPVEGHRHRIGGLRASPRDLVWLDQVQTALRGSGRATPDPLASSPPRHALGTFAV